MNRSQLEHIIRAAGDIAEDAEIVVIGSAAVFAQIPDLPETAVPSIEADVFPLNRPERSDLIDGSLMGAPYGLSDACIHSRRGYNSG